MHVQSKALRRQGASRALIRLAVAGTAALLLAGPAAATHVGEDLQNDELAVASNNLLLDTLRQWQRAPAHVREARLRHLLPPPAAFSACLRRHPRRRRPV